MDNQYTPSDPVGFEGAAGYYQDWELSQTSSPGTYVYLRSVPSLLTHQYYDASTGRFVNRDPIGYGGGANLYAYCGGNPVNEVDPDGTAVGHHIVPREVFEKYFAARTPVRKFFNSEVTGEVPGGHGWSKVHATYNDTVERMLNQFMAGKGISASQMTVADAREFVGVVKSSKLPAIRNLLNDISLHFAVTAAFYKNQKAASVVMSLMGRTEGKKLLGFAFKKLCPVVIIGLVINDLSHGLTLDSGINAVNDITPVPMVEKTNPATTEEERQHINNFFNGGN